jgi:quercetin dioxygenase-like cupin family protein
MNVNKTVVGALVLMMAAVGSARAQDPLKVASESYKLKLENNKVRVLEVHVAAGVKVPAHSHPAHVVVALSPCKVKFTLPDGKTADAEMKAGDVIWGDAVTHRSDNMGDSECHVVVLELKEAAAKM